MKQDQKIPFFSNIRIKNLLIGMLVITFFALIMMNILFSVVSAQAMEEQFRAHFSSVNANIENLVHNNNTFVESAIEQLCNTEQMQSYLLSNVDIDTHEAQVDSLKNIIALSDCVETIKIFAAEGFTISAAENEPLSMYILTSQYNLATTRPEKAFFSTLYHSPEKQNTYYIYVYPIRSAKLATFRQYLGTAVALINLDKILDNRSFTDYIRSSSCFVVDDSNAVLYSDGQLDAAEFYKTCLAQGDQEHGTVSSVQHQGTAYFYASASVSELNWQIYTVVEQKDLASQTLPLHVLAVILSILSGGLILLIAIILIKNIYQPIRRIVEDMDTIRLGHRDHRVRITSHNELGKLAAHTNSMLEELDASANRLLMTQQSLYEAELAEKKSQMQALQSQINPHFLYNTLECMQGIAMEHQIHDIVKIASSMARIFRYSIASSSHSTLGEELSCVKHYLSIMQIRFGSEVTLVFDVPEACLGLSILRMTLQPIVENAFTHGLENNGGDGLIRITARQAPDTLVVSVSNSGKVLSAADAALMNQRFRKNAVHAPDANINGGVALMNINRRLMLSDPVNGGIQVSTTDDGLTCFTLTFRCP